MSKSSTTQHIVPGSKGWSVRKGGATRASKIFKTKREAVAYGVKISKKQGAELYIHRRDGLVQNKRSFSNTPAPSQ